MKGYVLNIQEYRVFYHWDNIHYTVISVADTLEGIWEYLENNLAAMEDAVEDTPEAYFQVGAYIGNKLIATWEEPTPQELLDIIKKECSHVIEEDC